MDLFHDDLMGIMIDFYLVLNWKKLVKEGMLSFGRGFINFFKKCYKYGCFVLMWTKIRKT